MYLTRDRIRSIGWAFVLAICAALTAGLTLRVNAVKSQVHDVERQIVGLQHEISFLETEFQARSNQQQLKILNDVEFGYKAPSAEQYIEGERQLAALGKPRTPDAPAPIRFASAAAVAGNSTTTSFLAMVSPITGVAQTVTSSDVIGASWGSDRREHKESFSHVSGSGIVSGTLAERLAHIDLRGPDIE